MSVRSIKNLYFVWLYVKYYIFSCLSVSVVKCHVSVASWILNQVKSFTQNTELNFVYRTDKRPASTTHTVFDETTNDLHNPR